MWFWLAITLARAEGLKLPPGEPQAEWQRLLEGTGLELVGGAAEVELRADPWRLIVSDGLGRREIPVEPPSSEADRQDLIFLALSLLRAGGAGEWGAVPALPPIPAAAPPIPPPLPPPPPAAPPAPPPPRPAREAPGPLPGIRQPSEGLSADLAAPALRQIGVFTSQEAGGLDLGAWTALSGRADPGLSPGLELALGLATARGSWSAWAGGQLSPARGLEEGSDTGEIGALASACWQPGLPGLCAGVSALRQSFWRGESPAGGGWLPAGELALSLRLSPWLMAELAAERELRGVDVYRGEEMDYTLSPWGARIGLRLVIWKNYAEN